MKVTFCGSSQLMNRSAVEKWLHELLTDLIQAGADEFYLGGYGAYDLLAARVIQALKKDFPCIRSILVLPYLNHRYTKELYDETVYPELERVPKPLAIVRRNEWMINKADLVVCCVEYCGRASKTMEYAIRRKKEILCFPEGWEAR